MSNTKMSTNQKIKRMVTVAVFCALAYVVMFIFRINVSFLTFDLKDALITICGLTFGPVAALVSSLLVAALEFITVSDTGIYGFLMNFISSAAFACTAALVYKFKKDFWGAFIAVFSAIGVLIATMMAFNIIITPPFMKVDRSLVISMIPTLFLPFNAVKATFNAAVVLLLYKPISTALKATNVTRKSEHNNSGKGLVVWQLLLTIGLAITFIAVASFGVCMLINQVGGGVSWFNFGK